MIDCPTDSRDRLTSPVEHFSMNSRLRIRAKIFVALSLIGALESGEP